MGIILKKAINDFRELGWRRILIFLTIILSLGGGLGLYYGMSIAIPMMDRYFDDANHADYTYQLEDETWMTQSQLDGLDDLKEVDQYTGRLMWSTSLQFEGQNERKYILLVGIDYDEENNGHPEVYDYDIRDGKNFDPDDNNKSIVIDETFANVNNLDIGDTFKIDGLNDAEVKISGKINSPEFIMMTSNPEFLFPVEGSMGVIYISKDTLKNYITGYYIWYNTTIPEDLTAQIGYFQSIDYNSIAIRFNGEVEEGNKVVKDYLSDQGLNVVKAEFFEDSYAYSLMKADVSDTGEIMMILLVFMALLGGIIVYIIFNRYVYSQKQQIGIMLGLGYTKRDVLKYFMFNIILIFSIAVPLGIATGYGFGYVMMGGMMAEMAAVEPFYFPFMFESTTLIFGLIMGFFMVFFSTYFSVRKIGKRIIAELIYEQEEVKLEVRKSKKTKKPKNITNKLVFKNLFRNKKRLAFTIIAMMFSLLIVSSAESLMDSMYYNVDRTFQSSTSNVEPNQKWDLNVNFQTAVNDSATQTVIDDIQDIADVEKVVKYSKGLITINGKEDINLIVQGINVKDSGVHSFNWDDEYGENEIPTKSNEIAISSVHALKLDKKVGDNIEIENAFGEKFDYVITGVHSELLMTAYITLNAGFEILHNNSDYLDGAYVILDDNADREKITEDIYDLGNIEIVFDSLEMNEKAIDFIENYAVIMRVITYYTFVVSFFIVLYNSVMNIYDKNYEYGILRSLGYSKKRIFKIILVENFLQGILPIILAIAFTFPLTEQMTQIYAENFPLEPIISPTAIFMITIPPLILYFLGSLIGLRTVFKQNLYEQVQTRFVG